MKHTTVILLLDAGRSDHVRADTMPFLHGLAQQGASGSLMPPPGFAERAALFTGRQPDGSGHFGAFVFDPARSPYRWTRRLGPLRRLIPARGSAAWVRRALGKMTHWISGATESDPAWIPPHYLPFFRRVDTRTSIERPGGLGVTSLFDLCRERGIRYRYLASDGDDDAVHDVLVRELRSGSDCGLHVADLRTVAIHASEQGPFSDPLMKGHLREVDDKIASVHAALTAGYDSWDLLVCGPHGVAPVREAVDVAAALREADAQPGKDYVVFVHSTLTSFWYLTEKGRRAVEAVLPAVPGSRVIDDDERRRRHIPTDRAWGDRILAAEPGTVYRPDFFHPKDSALLGVHGHLDKAEEGTGMAVLASSRDLHTEKDLGQRALIDVFPTLLDLIGVAVPQGQEGTSFVHPAAPPVQRPDHSTNGAGPKKVLTTEH